MNPTLAQTLDPKLKEAYDRVMGATVEQKAEAPSATPAPQPQVPPTQTQPVEPVTQVYHAQTQPVSTVNIEKKPSLLRDPKISWWIFLLMGIAFFIVYALIWIRVFNVSIF